MSVPPEELREIYVWTFDWKEKTRLYLTAHELGDSRERRAALILLQHIVRDAGFMMPSGELCDFIPLLYELLAVRSDHVHVRALELSWPQPQSGFWSICLKTAPIPRC